MKSRWIQPDGSEEEHDSPNEPTLSAMQEFVGGHIEIVNVLYEDRACHMIVHDEGMLLRLPVNAKATNIYHAASRSRGVDPLNPVALKADRDEYAKRTAEAIGVPLDNIHTIDLGDPLLPPCIYGPAIVFEGKLS